MLPLAYSTTQSLSLFASYSQEHRPLSSWRKFVKSITSIWEQCLNCCSRAMLSGKFATWLDQWLHTNLCTSGSFRRPWFLSWLLLRSLSGQQLPIEIKRSSYVDITLLWFLHSRLSPLLHAFGACIFSICMFQRDIPGRRLVVHSFFSFSSFRQYHTRTIKTGWRNICHSGCCTIAELGKCIIVNTLMFYRSTW